MTSRRASKPSLLPSGWCSYTVVTWLLSPVSNFVSLHASVIVAGAFAALTIAAAGFAAWPAWSRRGAKPLAHAFLAGAIALFVIGIGGGTYLLLGRPELAERTISAPDASDVPALVAELARRMRDRPGDVAGWTLLGRGYLTLSDASQAAIAFRHASDLAMPQQKPGLLSAYGEALVLSTGSVTPEAEAAFDEALAGNPKDDAARYYLGEAYADRHQSERALALWRSLLADAPPNAPWRAELINRIAMLQSMDASVPNIRVMVAGLAARLKSNPDDPDGWERLIRAYKVLGENIQARSALASAQAAMKGRPKALAALEAEAQSLGIEK